MRPRLLDSRLLCILALCLAASTGCASKVVTRVNAEKGVTSDGVSYFLPTNSVRIVFTNTTIASDVKKANAALKKAKKDVKTATGLLATAEKKLAARDPKKKQDAVQLSILTEIRRASFPLPAWCGREKPLCESARMPARVWLRISTTATSPCVPCMGRPSAQLRSRSALPSAD